MIWFYLSVIAFATSYALNLVTTESLDEKLEKLNKMLEGLDEKTRENCEKLLSFALDNPLLYLLLCSCCPLLHIFIIFSNVKDILKEIS